jgi:hypothetical protein
MGEAKTKHGINLAASIQPLIAIIRFSGEQKPMITS